MTDKHDVLKDEPFSYRTGKDKVFIYYNGREIMTLKDKRASKLLYKLEGESEFNIQLILAKITGQFN